jgi:hypothetical protein
MRGVIFTFGTILRWFFPVLISILAGEEPPVWKNGWVPEPIWRFRRRGSFLNLPRIEPQLVNLPALSLCKQLMVQQIELMETKQRKVF